MQRQIIAVIYGGKSTEHEVSVHSAKEVCALLAKKHKVLPIYIDKKGKWFLQKTCGTKKKTDKEITPLISGNLFLIKENKTLKVDIYFPILHGAFGEDGTIQGLFEMLGKPYVGCKVLSSAIGMDKEISKIIAESAGIPILPYIQLNKADKLDKISICKKAKQLGYPLFVKPVSLGSSIGITKVKKESELLPAIKLAFQYEDNILIEKGIDKAREVFCGVFSEKGYIKATQCGELIQSGSEFFDYDTKYNNPHGCDMQIPAKVSPIAQKKMQEYSLKFFQKIKGLGLARIDFLLSKNGNIYFSEINTMPGMSTSSLFPNLCIALGITYEKLINILLESAIYSFKK